jgi:hypothetical protein
MEPFEYLSVLISIIVGLGLTHLMTTGARLIQERGRVRFFVPTLVWMGMLFVLHIQIWWAAFEWQSRSSWTFFAFLLFLALPIGAYLLSILLVPDLDRAEDPDLRQSYFANRVWFFGLLSAMPVVSLLHEAVHGGAIEPDADAAFRVVFGLTALLGLGSRNESVHWGIALGYAAAFAAYVAVLFRRLPV